MCARSSTTRNKARRTKKRPPSCRSLLLFCMPGFLLFFLPGTDLVRRTSSVGPSTIGLIRSTTENPEQEKSTWPVGLARTEPSTTGPTDISCSWFSPFDWAGKKRHTGHHRRCVASPPRRHQQTPQHKTPPHNNQKQEAQSIIMVFS